MTRAPWLLLPLFAGACTEDPPSPDPPVVLVSDGRSSHGIVLDAEASPSERHAADELQRHVEACTGVRLPVRTGPAEPGEPVVVVGGGEPARALGVQVDEAELGDQGSLLQTVGSSVVLAGTRQGGTLYGVHRLLEEHLGVRWWAPGVTETPALTEVVLPATRRVVRPAFSWRNTSYEWPGADQDFLTRMADNGGSAGPDDPHGARWGRGGSAHSYFRFVSPGDYFEEHPEYFSEIGGVRTSEETQLCLTNPDVLEIVTEKMLQEMAEDPGERQHTFSQMDHYNACECDRCREVNERYGTTGGTQFWFVNQLAERTSEVWPDKLVRTLAYMYTEEPPQGLELHDNVSIWLCHMYPSCDSHPIAGCPRNADYARRARAWAELAPHLYVWHYVTNFTHYYVPFPNLRALAADLRFYRDLGVEGVFLQGMGHSGGGGEFSLLRPWYGLRLLWDPDRDERALVEEILRGYYGPAGRPLADYVDLLHDEVEDHDIHMHLYTGPGQGYLGDHVIREARRLFDEAEGAVAGDAELLERVRVARMPLVYARLFPRNGYELKDGRLVWRDEIASADELTEFVERMERHGFRTVREYSGGTETLWMAQMVLGADLDVETIASPHLVVDVVPMLGGRALRIVERGSGECVTAYDRTQVLFFPFAGGLEDRVGGLFRFFGWVEPARVVARDDASLTVRLSTLDGLSLTRTLTLAPDAPVLGVETTVDNPTDGSREVRLRSHLELDLGELRETRVRFVDRAGREVESGLDAVLAGQREGVHYYDRQAPAGAWTLSGSKGLQLVQRFDEQRVDFTWLYAYPEDLGQLDAEVWVRRAELGPGESLTFRWELEVRPTP